ncbi:hypothetical protein E2562_021814 [Oryza meyeriana var. granulata]|uniref:Protein kinase domain-containing protein n=1 Tax=Oryza meyeriana var. granulata TaxID=110450 RepID=A0A6G1EN92_9ORYZ|nr:hypothetical protein E2562_021814 [Oryza meyeriana var. granulata]
MLHARPSLHLQPRRASRRHNPPLPAETQKQGADAASAAAETEVGQAAKKGEQLAVVEPAVKRERQSRSSRSAASAVVADPEMHIRGSFANKARGEQQCVQGARLAERQDCGAGLKKVRFDNLELNGVRFMAREILILRRLDHPNVIELDGLVTS